MQLGGERAAAGREGAGSVPPFAGIHGGERGQTYAAGALGFSLAMKLAESGELSE